MKNKLRGWLWEIAALVGSIVMFVALVSLLAVFDGKDAFEWNGISLNTIISILSVIMRAFLIFSVAECIGQWKWILFARSQRSLLDFEYIDLASRGPLGCIGLVGRKQIPWVLWLGVVASLLSIGLVPFSQQLVKLEQSIRYVDEVNNMKAISPSTKQYMLGSSVNAVSSIDPEDFLSGKPHAFMAIAEVDISMRSAVFNALAQPTSPIQQLGNIHCPTGNYSNVVALVTPNGHFLPNKLNWTIDPDDLIPTAGFIATTFGTGNPNLTNTMGDLDTLFWSQTITYVDRNEIKRKENEFVKQRGKEETPWKFWPNVPVRSEECALYCCVKSITSAVNDGVVHEVPQLVTEAVRNPNSWKPKHSKLESVYASENIPEDKATLKILEFNEKYSAISMDDLILYFPDDPDKSSFHLSEDAVKSISSLFQELFIRSIEAAGNLTHLQKVADKLLDQDAVIFNGFFQGLNWEPPFLEPVLGEHGSALADIFEKLALSMTNEMRVNGAFKNESREGLVGTLTALYQIEWYWVITHCIVFVAAATFCLLTMFSTLYEVPTVPLWKSSALAAISQATGAAEMLQDVGTIDDLKKKASNEVAAIPVGKNTKLLYGVGSPIPEEPELGSCMQSDWQRHSMDDHSL